MNTCLILGAGATLANAESFHKVRYESKNPPLDATFFDKIGALGITIPRPLKNYAQSSPGLDPFNRRVGQPAPSMEEFFRDLFIDFQETVKGSDIAKAYEQLVNIYLRVLRETTDWIGDSKHTGGSIGRLLAKAADSSETIDVITFNHDLVIENEIEKRARLRSRWCLQEGYGHFGSDLSFTTTSATNLFPAHNASCDHSRPINVLKLHGSLNWYILMQGRSPSLKILSGTGLRKTVRCTSRRVVPSNLTMTTTGGRTQYAWPVVVPPIHSKDSFIRKYLTKVWSDADESLRNADRIVFVGYSMPLLDVNADRLFRKAIAGNTSLRYIEVVNPAPESARRYAELVTTSPMHWYPNLESYLEVH